MKRLKVQLDQERAAKKPRRFTESINSPLLDYFCEINSNDEALVRPDWLSPIAAVFDRITKGDTVRAVISAPPQHGKTELCKAGLAQLIERRPKSRNAYISYSKERALWVGNQLRAQLAERGMVTSGAQGTWKTPEGGHMLVRGILGGTTGYPVDGVVVLDDIIADITEARSRTKRNKKIDVLKTSIITRIHPKVSVLLVATRWDPKDPSAELMELGFENVNLAAIAEQGDPLGREVGEALAPKIRPIEFLLAQKKLLGDHFFGSMFQGRPRPLGGTVFHDPTFFTVLPSEGYTVGFGVDLAYTANKRADWSICLEMWRVGQNPETAKFYIVAVDRDQCEAPDFTLTLKSRSTRRQGAKMLWRGSGTEKGSASFIKKAGVPLLWTPPPGDKFVSSMDVAAAWNDGRVLLPSTTPADYRVATFDEMPEFAKQARRWLPAFMASVGEFTGQGDEQDDDVDALGNAHKLLTSRKGDDNDNGGRGAGTAERPERLV
ncbi:MAG: hypothetical protein ABFD89_17630 [Bryobacteraceae bacterium]